MYINFGAMVKILLWATCKFAKWGNLYTIFFSFHVELYPQIKMAALIFGQKFSVQKNDIFKNFIISCKIRDLKKNDFLWHMITRSLFQKQNCCSKSCLPSLLLLLFHPGSNIGKYTEDSVTNLISLKWKKITQSAC